MKLRGVTVFYDSPLATFKLLRGMYGVGRQLELTRFETFPAEARRSKGSNSRRKTYDF